jgi:hypothetical protein
MSITRQWQKFVLNEEVDAKNIFAYIQGLQEIISNLKPKTLTEKRRITLAKQHLREVKKYARRMQTDITVLQEKLQILEESKGNE